jgi:hypothetical protein
MTEQQPDTQILEDATMEIPTLAQLWAVRQQRIAELRDKSPVRIPTRDDIEVSACLGREVSKLMTERHTDG